MEHVHFLNYITAFFKKKKENIKLRYYLIQSKKQLIANLVKKAVTHCKDVMGQKKGVHHSLPWVISFLKFLQCQCI